MSRRYLAAAAMLTAAGLAVSVQWRTGSTTEETSQAVALQRGLVAWLISREGLPATGQCQDIEVSLQADDETDAGPRPSQRVWAACALEDGTQTWEQSDAGWTARADLPARCTSVARALCRGDAGTDDPPPGYARCWRDAAEACQQALQRAGGVVWRGESYPSPDGGSALRRLARRELMQQSCACASRADAGACRERIAGADAGPYVRLLQPGEMARVGGWVGPGCKAAPCVESEAREAAGGPGSMMPAECR